MRVVVIGSSGHIGSYTVPALVQALRPDLLPEKSGRAARCGRCRAGFQLHYDRDDLGLRA